MPRSRSWRARSVSVPILQVLHRVAQVYLCGLVAHIGFLEIRSRLNPYRVRPAPDPIVVNGPAAAGSGERKDPHTHGRIEIGNCWVTARAVQSPFQFARVGMLGSAVDSLNPGSLKCATCRFPVPTGAMGISSVLRDRMGTAAVRSYEWPESASDAGVASRRTS